MSKQSEPKLVIFTGAGISADSGIPTFRDNDGLWEGVSPDLVANGLTWKKNRDMVIRFYNDRRIAAGQAQPNAGHRAIADWQKRFGAFVITQNVDGLLEAAGCSQVLHVHGLLSEMRCEACGGVWSVGNRAWAVDERCRCGSIKGTRPNVVMFNELAPNYAIMNRVFEGLSKRDVLLVMGTSGCVIDIGAIAFSARCRTILSNKETNRSIGVLDQDFDYTLHGRATDSVDQIDPLLEKLLGESVQDQQRSGSMQVEAFSNPFDAWEAFERDSSTKPRAG